MTIKSTAMNAFLGDLPLAKSANDGQQPCSIIYYIKENGTICSVGLINMGVGLINIEDAEEGVALTRQAVDTHKTKYPNNPNTFNIST